LRRCATLTRAKLHEILLSLSQRHFGDVVALTSLLGCISGGCCGRHAAPRRRLFAGQTIDEIARLRVRDDDRGKHDDEEGNGRPEAECVMPVEVACPALQAPLEPSDSPDGSPRPLARPPEINAARHNEQKSQVARSRHGATDSATLARSAEPAVSVHDGAEEGPYPRRALAQHPV
jgi:hypothetical protein